MRTGFIALAASLACLAGACSTAPAQREHPVAAQERFGMSKEHAIEVCRPPGERNYLARLACPDASHPLFDRAGSVGLRHDFPAGLSEREQMQIMEDNMGFKKLAPGAADHHVIDAYSVECGETRVTLYLDMYHCDDPAPTLAPAGFTLAR